MSEQSLDSPNVKPACTKEVVALLIGKNKNTLSNDSEYKFLKNIYPDLDSKLSELTKEDTRKNPYQGTVKYIIWK